MGSLIGRAKELREGLAVLQAARTQRVARLLRLAGSSGVGKTALAQALASDASRDGWLVAFVAAYRIQAGLPLAFASRVIDVVVGALGDLADGYISGLAKDAPDQTLFPLLQAVVLDRPLLIVADDAQWADKESRDLLIRTLQALADRPCVIISTERTDEDASQAFDMRDAAMAVGELDREASIALARSMLPEASEAVITAIADHGRGRAIDIVALTKSPVEPAAMTINDVTGTLRTLIARELTELEPAARTFLQLCSLIGEPIEYPLLRELCGDESLLLSLIERFSAQYLVQRGGSLYFAHAAIAQSIRETIAIDVPYRRRIYDALDRLPEHRLEDMQRLVEQASAMGDRRLEKRQLGRIVEEATRLNLPAVAARATERIISVTPFNEAESLALYSQLSIQYNALSRDGDTHRVCSEAFAYAFSHRIKRGLGQLVMSDLFALFFRGDRVAYDRSINLFDSYLETPNDRGCLAIGRLFRAVCDFDSAGHDAALREFKALDPTDPALRIRIDVFSAFHRARLGQYDNAFGRFESLRAEAQVLNPLLTIMVRSGELMMTFQAFGADHPHTVAALRAVSEDVPTTAYFTALTALVEGSLADAVSIATEQLVHIDGMYVRRHLLGVAATASLLSDVALPPALHAAIVAEASITLREPLVGAQVPLAAYLAAREGSRDGSALLDRLFALLVKQPLEPMIVFFPIVVVRAANALKRYDLLERIARGDLARDELKFNKAQHELAELTAASLTGLPTSNARALELQGLLASLGAPFFADLARGLVAPRVEAQKTEQLTRREREVSSLVADGRTNREIAEKLVLSERTIEAHLANIFSKLGASSRAQVASWYARQAMERA